VYEGDRATASPAPAGTFRPSAARRSI